MTEYFFGLHSGHYCGAQMRAVDQVEREFEDDRVNHINYTEPSGQKRGWWTCRNRGRPFDDAVASAVLARFGELLGVEHDA